MTPQSGTGTDTLQLGDDEEWTAFEIKWIERNTIGYLDSGEHAIFRIEMSGNKPGGTGLDKTFLDLLTIETSLRSTAPSTPTSLTASAIAFEAIRLTWTAPSEVVTGYKIENRSEDNSTWTEVTANTNSTSTTYNDTELVKETLYYYRVSAINAVGTSAASTEAYATTLKVMDSLLKGTNINAMQIVFGGNPNNAIKNRLSYLKAQGFDHIRIGYRMNKKDTTDTTIYLYEVFDGEYTHINRYLDIVNSALNEGFTVVIDPVHYEESNSNLVNANELVSLWNQIITGISSYSFDDSNLKSNIIFEIINEPRTYDPVNGGYSLTLDTIFAIIETIHNTFTPKPYCIFSGFDFNTYQFKILKDWIIPEHRIWVVHLVQPKL